MGSHLSAVSPVVENMDHLTKSLHDDVAGKGLHPCHPQGLLHMSPSHHVERGRQVQTHLKSPIEGGGFLTVMFIM